MAITFEANEPLGNLLNQLSSIGQKGRFNEQMKLPKPPAPTALKPFSGLQAKPVTQTITLTPTGGTAPSSPLPGAPQGQGDLARLMRAIRGQESSNNYRAENKGSGALGAYQILWSNLAANNGADWDRQALGRDVSREEFLSNPAIQDQIATYKLGQYLKNRGLAGAAATWYGGDWGYKHMYDKTPQNGYPSMYDYVMSILNRAG